MISEHDLNEAIAECMGQRNPNTSTCLKLAAFLTIKKELFGDETEKEEPDATSLMPFSYAASDDKTIGYYGDSEFAKAVHGHTEAEIMPVMDELMDALQVVNPRLYEGTMRRIR